MKAVKSLTSTFASQSSQQVTQVTQDTNKIIGQYKRQIEVIKAKADADKAAIQSQVDAGSRTQESADKLKSAVDAGAGG